MELVNKNTSALGSLVIQKDQHEGGLRLIHHYEKSETEGMTVSVVEVCYTAYHAGTRRLDPMYSATVYRVEHETDGVTPNDVFRFLNLHHFVSQD